MLKVSDAAISYIKNYAIENADQINNKKFRVYVEGGGCQGFQYGYSFDNQKEDDSILKFDGIEILVDEISAGFLKDCTVDYVSDLRGSGFIVRNPNATNKCGCGESFSC